MDCHDVRPVPGSWASPRDVSHSQRKPVSSLESSICFVIEAKSGESALGTADGDKACRAPMREFAIAHRDRAMGRRRRDLRRRSLAPLTLAIDIDRIIDELFLISHGLNTLDMTLSDGRIRI